MNRAIWLYRSITALWFALLVGALYFEAVDSSRASVACIVLVVALIAAQTLAFRCSNCGTRPSLWLLAIWMPLLDYELYIGDVVLLRKCPKCSNTFTNTNASGRAA